MQQDSRLWLWQRPPQPSSSRNISSSCSLQQLQHSNSCNALRQQQEMASASQLPMVKQAAAGRPRMPPQVPLPAGAIPERQQPNQQLQVPSRMPHAAACRMPPQAPPARGPSRMPLQVPLPAGTIPERQQPNQQLPQMHQQQHQQLLQRQRLAESVNTMKKNELAFRLAPYRDESADELACRYNVEQLRSLLREILARLASDT